MPERTQKLTRHVNRKDWWHVSPADGAAYGKRGMFLASSFKEAEFYGRPNDVAVRVAIAFPLIGDNDSVERNLLGRVESHLGMSVRERLGLDAKLRRAALQKGYDSIVLMSESGFHKFKKEGKLPRSIELNVVDLRCVKSDR